MSQINVNTIKDKSGLGAPSLPNGINATGVCTATTFSGSGSGLTNLNATNLSSGTVAIARLGDSGTKNGNTFLAGDNTFKSAPSTTINNNANNKLITGSSSANTLEAESTLSFDSSTDKLALTGSDSYINVGPNSNRFEIRNNNTSTYLYHYGGGTFHFALAGSANTIQFDSISQVFAQFNKGGACNLYHSNTKRFETTSTGASITGNLSVSGVLTYEDVTNVDSVGIVTARAGIRVTGDVIEAQAGENKIPSLYANLAALPSASTYHGMFAHVHSEGKGYFAHGGNWMELVNKDTNGVLGFTGALKEQVKITAGKLSANTDINLSDGMVHYFTTNETATATPNIRLSGSVTLNTAMSIGETISVTLISATNSASYYYDQLNIDGAATTENWVGGSAPTDGGTSGVDIYTYNIIKTADATFTVIANQTKTS